MKLARFFAILQAMLFVKSFLRTSLAKRSVTRRFLNRILFEANEVETINGDMIANVKIDDYRYKHVEKILKLVPGDDIRSGIIDVGLTNHSSILHCSTDTGLVVNLGSKNDLYLNEAPSVDIILAVPRPLRLERIIPVISCLGVNRIFLVGGEKVQKDYFGSHLFRKPIAMKELLIEGLSQAGMDCRIPEIIIRKDLKKFLTREINTFFPSSPTENCLKLVAHPPIRPSKTQEIEDKNPIVSQRCWDFLISRKEGFGAEKVVIAIGPEGGWTDGTDPELGNEIQLFIEQHFNLVNLGNRILRTDIAVPVLLGMINDWLDSRSENRKKPGQNKIKY